MQLILDGLESPEVLGHASDFLAALAKCTRHVAASPGIPDVSNAEPSALASTPAAEAQPGDTQTPKRVRRTKAQIEADNAAAAQGAQSAPTAAADVFDTAPKPEFAEVGKTPDVAEPAPPAAGPADTKPLTREDALAAIERVSSERGIDQAIAALREFNVTRISQLDPKDYAKFIDHCKGL